MPVRPFTLAARLMHYGRYGSGGEDPRLQPLFLGWPGLVRGYQVRLVRRVASATRPRPTRTAVPVFDQLLGSRMVVGNLELRFPLFGVLGVGSGYYGALPIDFDHLRGRRAGLGQRRDALSSQLGRRPRPRSSAPAPGLRFNLFGFAVAGVQPGPPVRAARTRTGCGR